MFYRVEVRDGKKASFWHEMWSSLGSLKEVLRDRGYIDMMILINATVAKSRNHRRRRHRITILNRVEEEIEKYKANLTHEEDVSLWRNEKGQYKRQFCTKETWMSIREKYQVFDWYPVVWFKYTTPKFSFITWLTMKGRLSTCDRMRS